MSSGTVAQPGLPRALPLPRFAAGAASLLLHLLVLLALLSVAVENNHEGRRSPARRQSLIITLAPEQKPQPPAAQPTPPAAAPEPRPDAQGQPARRPQHQAAAKPKVAAPPQAAVSAAPAPTEEQEIEDVLGRIHDNWLEPPGRPQVFRCRLRIDYLAGGNIKAVNFLQSCGSAMLDDTVRRAIWKTQPLPLSKAKQGAGSVEIEFLP